MNIENIKFKAKSLNSGKWIEGDLIRQSNGIYIRRHKNLSVIVDASTVCQFTGLKDCKGNEIWEHDLIHFVGYKPIGEVIWPEEDYAFMAASENEPLYLLPHVLEIGKIERVGNKFDKKK